MGSLSLKLEVKLLIKTVFLLEAGGLRTPGQQHSHSHVQTGVRDHWDGPGLETVAVVEPGTKKSLSHKLSLFKRSAEFFSGGWGNIWVPSQNDTNHFYSAFPHTPLPP